MRNIFIVVILVGVLAGGAWVMRRNSAPVPTSPDHSSISRIEPTSTSSATSGRYIPYTPSAFRDAAGTRRVLFFYASWCPTCRPADADFAANADKIPSDVTLIRVNYNDPDTDSDEKALAAKYAVTYQHTFVQIDEQGKQVTVWNGGKTAELLDNLKGSQGGGER